MGAAVLLVGATFFHFVEGLRWLDAFYMATITLTTVGYGDMTPKTDAGKLFVMVYAVVGLGIFAAVIDALAQRRAARIRQIRERRNKRRS